MLDGTDDGGDARVAVPSARARMAGGEGGRRHMNCGLPIEVVCACKRSKDKVAIIATQIPSK